MDSGLRTTSGMNEEDIRPAQMMLDKQSCLDVDRGYLLSHKDEWVQITCPACDCERSAFRGEKKGLVYVECPSCGMVYTNPRPSQELLHVFYKGSQNYKYWNKYIFPATEDVRRTKIFRPRVQRVLSYCKNPGTLLEVGAGFGTFCEEFAEFGRVIALEPCPVLAETCRSKGLEVINLPIEEVEKVGIADIVVAFEVIEHLFSPRSFIEQCTRLLRPGGLLILTCPNVRGFDVATLGMLSDTFDHEHLNYFHPRALSGLLRLCGFEIVDVQTPGQLDAGIVRKHVLKNTMGLEDQPFLKEVLITRWEELGQPFQSFLVTNCLSSHLWIVGRRA